MFVYEIWHEGEIESALIFQKSKRSLILMNTLNAVFVN